MVRKWRLWSILDLEILFLARKAVSLEICPGPKLSHLYSSLGLGTSVVSAPPSIPPAVPLSLWDRVSLCSPGWPSAHCVAWADLDLLPTLPRLLSAGAILILMVANNTLSHGQRKGLMRWSWRHTPAPHWFCLLFLFLHLILQVRVFTRITAYTQPHLSEADTRIIK